MALLGFGGPTGPSEIRPFLDRVLSGRPVPPERYEEVVRHYERLGGSSPYNQITMRQRMGLEANLHQMGIRVPIVAGFRHVQPFFDDVLDGLIRCGVHRALAFILAPHRSEASWDRYVNEMTLARGRLGAAAPEIEYQPVWHNHPLFVAAVADLTLSALEKIDAADDTQAELIFTAHSIPLSMGGRAMYVEQLTESARLIARQLEAERWTLAFQSRSGNPREPWLEPDVKDVLRERAGNKLVIVPVGFLCDHVEVLYDLDIEAAQIAREAGVKMARAATLGDHPKFLKMLAEIASQHLTSGPVAST
ncbi:MAG TPA: ferrochelatase [Candidatus Binataceae bacterium]|nr:ferrochelatase [Candidatus Binataceae bacterium]